MYSARTTRTEDYEWLCQWWKDNKFPPPPLRFLPDNGRDGIIISKDGVDVCAGFIYSTNSAFGWVEYIVANHEVKDRKVRKKAQQLLIDTLCQYAKQLGFESVFTSCKNIHLKERFLESDFVLGTAETNELIKIL